MCGHSMTAVRAMAMSSCFGGTEATLDALAAGSDGTASLYDCAGFVVPGVEVVYADPSIDVPYALRAEEHLRRAWGEVTASGVLDGSARTAVVACSGLGRTPMAETGDGAANADVLRTLTGESTRVYSISNACSASGMGIALAEMLLASGGAERVVVAAADSMSRSMLTMIGRVASAGPASRCQPFDRDRRGAVLGEGAAVCVLTRGTDEGWDRGSARETGIIGRILSTAVSTDAAHLTAPDAAVIGTTVDEALRGAGVGFADIDVVVPHGTGTDMNDRIEAEVYGGRTTSDATFVPLKGLLGHTSGASFLMSTITALHLLRGRPAALSRPSRVMDGAEGFRFAAGGVVDVRRGLAMVSAYGFGGVNAVSVVAA